MREEDKPNEDEGFDEDEELRYYLCKECNQIVGASPSKPHVHKNAELETPRVMECLACGSKTAEISAATNKQVFYKCISCDRSAVLEEGMHFSKMEQSQINEISKVVKDAIPFKELPTTSFEIRRTYLTTKEQKESEKHINHENWLITLSDPIHVYFTMGMLDKLREGLRKIDIVLSDMSDGIEPKPTSTLTFWLYDKVHQDKIDMYNARRRWYRK